MYQLRRFIIICLAERNYLTDRPNDRPGKRVASFAALSFVRSHAKPVGAIKRGRKEMSTRKSYVRTLRAAGLLDKTSTNGAYGKWIHWFGQHDIGLHIDENLGLEGGTYDGKRRKDLKSPRPTHQQTLAESIISPRAIRLRITHTPFWKRRSDSKILPVPIQRFHTVQIFKNTVTRTEKLEGIWHQIL
jgi:hypothetical protein